MRRLTTRIAPFVLGFVYLSLSCSDSGTSDGTIDPEKLITHQELIDACVSAGACAIKRATVSSCVDEYYTLRYENGEGELWSSIYRCINKAPTDCAKVRNCLGYASQPDSCDQTYTPKCEGNTAYNCDLFVKWEQGIDCAQGGMSCVIRTSGTLKEALCSHGSCDASSFKTYCKDNRLYTCSSGAIEIEDCSTRSLVCDEELALCRGTGSACGIGSAQCDHANNDLYKCVGGHVMIHSCDKSPGDKICKEGGAACEGAGTECIENDPDSCDGDTLISCIDGYKTIFDCKALGFLGCEPATVGANCKPNPIN